MQHLSSFFLFASGVEMKLLNECPSDKSKYLGIGATIFFTGVFAALAAGYALHTVFENIWLAAVLGTLWGLMIFNLDRYIVSSMRKENRAVKQIISAIPRLMLALAISLVIAKPLELKIFEKEIESELVVMEQQTYARQEAETRSRFEPSIQQIKEEIDVLKNEVNTKLSHRNALLQAAQQEADGTGGSMKKNLGPIYKLKKTNADRAENELHQLTELNDQKITNLEAQRNQLQTSMNVTLNNLEKNKPNGLAARLEALSRLTDRSAAVWWANLFIIILFIIVETSPIIVKLISRTGPYDNLLRITEYQFICRETESVAIATAETKQRTAHLGKIEKLYVSNKLDTEIS